MTTTTTVHTDRRLVLCGYAAFASVAIAVLVTVVEQLGNATVSEDQWSYPLTPTMLWVISVPLSIDHLFQALVFVGLTIARPYGTSRAAHVTTWVAVGGFLLLAVAELLSGAIGAEPNDSGVAGAVGTVFGVASLLTAVGGIVAGIAIIRHRQWSGIVAWSVLLTAVAILLLVTPANISGSGAFRTIALLVWSLLFLPIGVGLIRSRPGQAQTAT